jgi:hypothetical protein
MDGRPLAVSPFVTPPPHTANPVGSGLTRHASLSGRARRTASPDTTGSAASPLAHLTRKFADFGERAQPAFETVRYKAEAGLSRKGFLHHSHRVREEASLLRERSMENIELESDGAAVDSGDEDWRRGRATSDERWAARSEWRPL